MDKFYLIIMLLPYALGIFSVYTTLKFNDKTLYFGVRLPIDFKLTDELKNIKSEYKKITGTLMTLAFIVGSIVYFSVPEEFSTTAAIITIFAYPLIGIVGFAKANSKASSIKKRDKWSGYSKNMLVLDLDYRNKSEKESNVSSKLFIVPVIITVITFVIGVYSYITTKDEMVPGVFGNNGVIEGLVKRGDIISIWEYLMPLGIQVLVILTIFLSYIMIIKSKQIINGGEVENLKIYNKKIRNAGIYFISLVGSIESLLFMGIYCSYSLNSSNLLKTIIPVAIIILLLILTIVYTLYYQKTIKQYRKDYEIKDGKMIINRDDDKNYLWGMYYNNPNDPALFLPKRVGTGYDFNYGNLKVKIGAVLLGVGIVCVLGVAAFVMPFSMGDKYPQITSDSIKITGMYGSEIKKDNISSISLENTLPNNLERTNGAAMKAKLLGNFKVDNTYKAKMYISNSKEKVIKILKKDGSLVYINNSTKESTEKLFNTLKSYQNS